MTNNCYAYAELRLHLLREDRWVRALRLDGTCGVLCCHPLLAGMQYASCSNNTPHAQHTHAHCLRTHLHGHFFATAISTCNNAYCASAAIADVSFCPRRPRTGFYLPARNIRFHCTTSRLAINAVCRPATRLACGHFAAYVLIERVYLRTRDDVDNTCASAAHHRWRLRIKSPAEAHVSPHINSVDCCTRTRRQQPHRSSPVYRASRFFAPFAFRLRLSRAYAVLHPRARFTRFRTA